MLPVLLTGGCNNFPIHKTSNEATIAAAAGNQSGKPAEFTKPFHTESATVRDREQGRQEIVEIGSGQYTAPPVTDKTHPSVINKNGDITLNFQETDLREFIKAVLGDIMGKNYLVDSKVGGKVTIETSSPITRKNLFPLFEEILSANNAAVIETDGFYHIVPKDQAMRGNVVPTAIQRDIHPGYSVRVIPLQFIAAQEMQKILEPFVSDAGSLHADIKRNLLIASGTPKELNVIQDTVSLFDVNWMRGMSMGLYPLDYVDPKSLKTELESIIGAIQVDASKELLGGLVRIVPIERLNSILIISSTPSALREVEIWIHRLDRQGSSSGQRLFVYDVQNAKAVDLADILGQIFKGSGAKNLMRQRQARLAPGLNPVQIEGKQTSGSQQASAANSGQPVTQGVAIPDNDNIEIIADDVRNALVVLATPQDYKMVETAIRKLDIVPLQVLIEASILEVTLNDDLSYGVEWYFNNGFNSNKVSSGRGVLDLGKGNTLAAPVPSFSYTIVNTAAQVRLAISALENESKVNVLSSPSLMVLDNQTATINVGDEIPVPTRQSVSVIDSTAPTVNEIQFRKTGVTLTVTPRVNSSGLVTMDIKQEVSNAVSTTTSALNAPTIQNRQVESTVAINSGDTIILGGLIQDTQTKNGSGIPGLHRIPILGKLFGQTKNEMIRTELLVLITPRVVGSRNDAKEITNEFRRKLRGLIPLEVVPVKSKKEKPS